VNLTLPPNSNGNTRGGTAAGNGPKNIKTKRNLGGVLKFSELKGRKGEIRVCCGDQKLSQTKKSSMEKREPEGCDTKGSKSEEAHWDPGPAIKRSKKCVGPT